MKNEIEARLLNVNAEDFISKLEKVNAQFIGDWLQIRQCYDFNPVDEKRWIRLRTNGIETTITIKEICSSKIDGTKELEINVPDFETGDEFLNKLGYTARTKQENRRIQYILDGVEIDIDLWPHLPTYVEFEAKSEQAIIDVCYKLGVNYSKLTTIDNETLYKLNGIDVKHTPFLVLEEYRKVFHRIK